jgi:predicted secreted Zn-dependent protease
MHASVFLIVPGLGGRVKWMSGRSQAEIPQARRHLAVNLALVTIKRGRRSGDSLAIVGQWNKSAATLQPRR